jgi:ribosome biogenesis protein BRX1
LAEIGPRFVLNLIKIFDSSFCGRVLYSNPHYVSPNKYRRELRSKTADKYKDRVSAKQSKEIREPKGSSYVDVDKYDEVFDTVEPEKAKGRDKSVFQRNKQ